MLKQVLPPVDLINIVNNLNNISCTLIVTVPLILPMLNSPEEGSTGATEQSDTSSALGELDGYDSVSWSDSLCLSELEQLSLELANKGAPQSEVELRWVILPPPTPHPHFSIS